MQIEFTRKFEDKWSFIFLIAIPIIECLRILFFYSFSSKTLQKFFKFVAPAAKTVNDCLNFNHFGSDSIIWKKIKSFRAKEIETATTEEALIQIKIDSSDDDLPQKEKEEIDLSSLNTYDLFKIISTAAMFIDHSGYFGLCQIFNFWIGEHQSRIIGRFAAPGFFFLAGWSAKRFRLKTWFGAAFIYLFVAVIPLGITHSPWESIMNILLINCIFCYVPPHCIRNPFIHIAAFCALSHFRNYCSADLNIGYGTVPFILGIAGDLCKNQHFMAIFWVIAGMTVFAKSSIEIFASSKEDKAWIICECVMNALFMVLFKIKEVKIFNHFAATRVVRNVLKWISRNGLLIYCGHLSMFKLIQMTSWDGSFGMSQIFM